MSIATVSSVDDALTRYEPVIGLEVHVELGTTSKMFCGCPTTFGGRTPRSARCVWGCPGRFRW